MTTYQFFTTAWTWNSFVLVLSAFAFVGYFLAFGQRGRPLYFAAAIVVLLLALISPRSALVFFFFCLPPLPLVCFFSSLRKTRKAALFRCCDSGTSFGSDLTVQCA